MARIPEDEIERLKCEVSVARLIEGSGIALAKRGKDLVGACPFHQDDTPSLTVTPDKNLFHCFGCGAGGGPLDWTMKKNGVSFRHAVELLREGLAGVTDEPVKRTRVRALPAPVALDADDHALLDQVVGYYHESLKRSPEALAYLKRRGLAHPQLIDTFKLGFADRTLGLRLPEKTRKAGADIRARLERIGIYRESGHEHFNGSLIVPVLDERGHASELYGRKITERLRPGTPLHLYLPGPHRGVWNVAGIMASGGEIILTEALIDAMTFWVAGYRNVTAAYGVEGFTADHLAAFQAHGVKRVLIAFDRDEAGERGAAKIADQLMAEGFDCYRIEFPKTMDANAYAQKVTPASKSLGVLIRKASWLGKGKAPRLTSAPADLSAIALATADELAAVLAKPIEAPPTAAKEEIESASSLAASSSSADTDTAPIPEPVIASPLPPGPLDDPVLKKTAEELVLMQGDRQYRVRGWMKPLNPESMKVNLLVHRPESQDGRFHVDTLDLYNAKARASFIKQAGIELGEAEDVLKHDLGRVLLKLEALQDAELVHVLQKTERPQIGEDERADALALLRDPNLIARVLADFAICGIVGEETNTLTGYLACVSRLLDRPLAVIIQSSSAAGKSSLMDAVLALMPSEAQVRYSAMTGQSLFYMGETNLKHRILAIAEEEGAQSAGYALKLLQSDGEVTIASTGKDANTGLLVTQEYRVEGPVMLFLTTTAIDIDEELLNRCLVLTVNESRAQTRAIHALQRKRQTLDGLLQEEDRKAVERLHRNAQSLLERLHVVNPFADKLTFLDDKTRTRRDHMKYLTLIKAIALLHQHQRTIHAVEHRGAPLRYVEVEASDIALANKLAHEVLGRTLDELPPQTRAVLGGLCALVAEKMRAEGLSRPDVRFTRRELRERIGLSNVQLGVHLARLTALEYVLAHRGQRGSSFVYELTFDGTPDEQGPRLPGLIAVESLGDATTVSRCKGERSGFKGSIRPQNGGSKAGLRSAFIAETQDAATASAETRANGVKTHVLESSLASYRSATSPRSDLRSAGGQAPTNGAFPRSDVPSAGGQARADSSLAASSLAAKPDLSVVARRAKTDAA